MLILLIGPKGSGKSHIGRVLEQRLGVHFFHVEPHWVSYHRECAAAKREPVIAEGIARIHPLIREALTRNAHVCVETTGASDEILGDLLSMATVAPILKVRIRAPLDLCLRRIRARDASQQIPMDDERVRVVHALSESCTIRPDLLLENHALTDDEIVSSVAVQLCGPAQDRGDMNPCHRV